MLVNAHLSMCNVFMTISQNKSLGSTFYVTISINYRCVQSQPPPIQCSTLPKPRLVIR